MLELTDAGTTQCSIMSVTLKRADIQLPWGLELVSGTGPALLAAVAANSPAEASHALHPGDEIISINSQAVACLSPAELHAALTAPDAEVLVSFISRHPYMPSKDAAAPELGPAAHLRLIELRGAHEHASVGFELDGFTSASTELQRSGVFVARLQPWAAACGLRDGDQLIELSGARQCEWISLRLHSVETAAALLQAALERDDNQSLWVVVLPAADGEVLQGSRGTSTRASARPSIDLSSKAAVLPAVPEIAESIPEEEEEDAATVVAAPPTMSAYPPLPFSVRVCFNIADIAPGARPWMNIAKRDVLDVVDVSHEGYWLARKHGETEVGAVPSNGAVCAQMQSQEVCITYTIPSRFVIILC